MGLRRDSLYETFGGEREPRFSRVLKLLDSLDVQIAITPRKRRPKKLAAREAIDGDKRGRRKSGTNQKPR